MLPDVPVRQWVLTAPHEIRRVLALRPAALAAQNRLFVEEIARWQKQQAKARGIDGGETGSVPFVQRFDGALGSFVHLHVVALDGVFTRLDDGAVRFHLGPAPSVADVAAVGKRVAERMHRWMRRGKMFDQRPPEERSNEAPELSPLEACMQLSLFGGTFLKLDKNGVPLVDDEDDERHRSIKAWAALLLPVSGRWRERHQAEQDRMLRMDFRTFLQAFILVPAQILRHGRQLIIRLLAWRPTLPTLFRLLDAP